MLQTGSVWPWLNHEGSPGMAWLHVGLNSIKSGDRAHSMIAGAHEQQTGQMHAPRAQAMGLVVSNSPSVASGSSRKSESEAKHATQLRMSVSYELSDGLPDFTTSRQFRSFFTKISLVIQAKTPYVWVFFYPDLRRASFERTDPRFLECATHWLRDPWGQRTLISQEQCN